MFIPLLLLGGRPGARSARCSSLDHPFTLLLECNAKSLLNARQPHRPGTSGAWHERARLPAVLSLQPGTPTPGRGQGGIPHSRNPARAAWPQRKEKLTSEHHEGHSVRPTKCTSYSTIRGGPSPGGGSTSWRDGISRRR